MMTAFKQISLVSRQCKVMLRTEGTKCSTSPGKGVFPVGQLDAQKRFPKGSGRPSFASSGEDIIGKMNMTQSLWRTLIDAC